MTGSTIGRRAGYWCGVFLMLAALANLPLAFLAMTIQHALAGGGAGGPAWTYSNAYFISGVVILINLLLDFGLMILTDLDTAEKMSSGIYVFAWSFVILLRAYLA